MRRGLRERGYAVATAATGLAGLEHVLREAARTSCCSTSACPTWTGCTLICDDPAASQVPIIVITAQDDDPTMVQALDGGADDYVVKPFGTDQVAARIRAVLRRGGRDEHGRGRVRVGDLVIDERTRTATLAGEPLDLARKEFDLLLALASRAGRGRHQAGAAGRGVAAGVRRRRPHRGRPPVVAAPQARRDRGRAALPAQRARGRRTPRRPRAEARLMRRRISWLVVATTSTVVVSFVIPLCLLVRTLAEDRAMAAADQEARNVAILVAGLPDDPRQLRASRAPTSTVAPRPRTARADQRTAAWLGGRAVDRADDPEVRRARCAARPSRWSTTTAAGCSSPWSIADGTAVVRSRR